MAGRQKGKLMPSERKQRPSRKRGRVPAAPELTAGALVAGRLEGTLPPEQQSFTQYRDGMTLTEKRIDEIIDAMTGGRWVVGQTGRVLAEQWNVHPDYVGKLAAEASRHVRRLVEASPDFADECRAEVLTTFRTIRAVAMQKATDPKAKHNAAGNLMAALHATRMFGFYVGIEPAKKLETTQTAPRAGDGWSREEMERFVVLGERPARLAEARAELPPAAAVKH
jgi:hypothetical protein